MQRAEPHRDAQAAFRPGPERERPAMGLRDAPDDREAQPDSGMIAGAGTLAAALERLDQGGCARRVSTSPVFSTTSSTVSPLAEVITSTVPCSGRLWTMALCSRFDTSWSSSG